jgi:hypothetical protein
LAVSSIRDRTIKTLGNFQHNRSTVARVFGKWSHQSNQIAPSLLNFRHAGMGAVRLSNAPRVAQSGHACHDQVSSITNLINLVWCQAFAIEHSAEIDRSAALTPPRIMPARSVIPRTKE